MKSKLIIYFFVAILPSMICDDKTLLDYSNDVEEIAKTNNGAINGVFKPFKGEILGIGNYGFTYRGELLPINKTIAMKFTTFEAVSTAQREYEMYSYLHAINNETVEKYGIPAVYYYGEWNELLLIGLTLLDKDIDPDQLVQHEVNVLIVIRDFILASKYIHHCGIRHDDVKLENLMVRNHRTFLIDYNLSSKMNVNSGSGTPYFESRRTHCDFQRYPKDDWESFLYSMCYTLHVRFYRMNTTKTINEIKKMEYETLRKIFLELAEHIFDDGCVFESDNENSYSENEDTPGDGDNDKLIPDYDHYYELVSKEIKRFDLPKPIMFTWLDRDERNRAIQEANDYPTPNITLIQIRSRSNISYPEVKRNYFVQLYKDWKSTATQKTFVPADTSQQTGKRRKGDAEMADTSSRTKPIAKGKKKKDHF